MIFRAITYVNLLVTKFITKMCSMSNYSLYKELSANTLSSPKIKASVPVSKSTAALFIFFTTLTLPRKSLYWVCQKIAKPKMKFAESRQEPKESTLFSTLLKSTNKKFSSWLEDTVKLISQNVLMKSLAQNTLKFSLSTSGVPVSWNLASLNSSTVKLPLW